MILYKKDSKGKIRFVEIYPEGDKVVQKHGILDGAVVYNESKCIGKNIGKSNETTPERQAELEAQSKLLKKLDEGYYKTIDEANNETVVLPMLAKDFKEEVHKVSYPVYVQPKYYASSKTCGCGVKNENLKLSDRVWTCNSCGTENSRDHLASQNILKEGRKSLGELALAKSEA